MRQVLANGISTAVDVRGEGPPIVLLHGREGDHAMFDALARALEPNFTVALPDQRDCGRTDNGADGYSLDTLADDVSELIAALGWPRAHVLGQSFGGLIAQALAARHPDRVDRLILSSTFRLGGGGNGLAGSALGELAALRANGAADARTIAGFYFAEAFLQAHLEAALAILATPPRAADKQARRAAAILAPIQSDVAAIRAPTLVIGGAHDRLSPPAHAADIVQSIAAASVLILEGVGHVGPVEAPDAIAQAVVDFTRRRT